MESARGGGPSAAAAWRLLLACAISLLQVLRSGRHSIDQLTAARFILWAWEAPFTAGKYMYAFIFPYQLAAAATATAVATPATATATQFTFYRIGTCVCLAGKLAMIAFTVHFLAHCPLAVFHTELFNSINMICWLLYTCGLQSYAWVYHTKLRSMLQRIRKMCMDFEDKCAAAPDWTAPEGARGGGHQSGQSIEGVTVMMLCLLVISVWAPAVLALGLFYLLQNNLMFQMFQTGSVPGNVAVSVGVWYWITFEMILILCYAHSYIAYAALLLDSLRELEWRPGERKCVGAAVGRRRPRQQQQRYRALQALHSISMDAGAPIIAGMFTAGTAFVIGSFYIVIRFGATLSPLYLLVIGTEGTGFTFAIQICIHLAMDVREAAVAFPVSYMRSAGAALSTHDQIWFRTLHPIEMWVGNMFPLRRRALFLAMFSFILENVCSLLVAF